MFSLSPTPIVTIYFKLVCDFIILALMFPSICNLPFPFTQLICYNLLICYNSLNSCGIKLTILKLFCSTNELQHTVHEKFFSLCLFSSRSLSLTKPYLFTYSIIFLLFCIYTVMSLIFLLIHRRLCSEFLIVQV